MELKTAIPAESGHWYARDGSPAYTIVGKNGKERNTTLRDARSLDLVPSVTTIIRTAAAPGLERWKLQQTLLASLTLPREDGESLDDYAERVIKDSREYQNQAMNLGTEIHGSLEKAFLGESFEVTHLPFVTAVREALQERYGTLTWVAEESFASPEGFGGKIDLYTPAGIVIDFKTKAFNDPDKVSGFDEHLMQLAAYAYGMEEKHPALFDRAANVFISTTVPGLVKVVEWTAEDIERGWKMFSALLQFWQIKNRYA